MTLWLDIESFSDVDIGNGLDNYRVGMELLMMAWGVDDGPITVWDTTQEPMPLELADAIQHADILCAHNAAFERQMLVKALPQFNWATPRWHCTMVQAYAHGLPGALDDLCEVYKLTAEQAKLKDGRALIQLFCKPQKKRDDKLTRATHATHPEQWARFKVYGVSDVVSMRALYHKMPHWNMTPFERELWVLDQCINDRGIAVDTELARKAVATVNREKIRLDFKTVEETDGAVSSTNRRDLLLKYILEEHGVTLPDMTKDTLQRRLKDESLPEAVRTLIGIRLEASLASVHKYKKLLKVTSTDGRMRNGLQFCGAQRTGRWAGRGFQVQNIKRVSETEQEELDLQGYEAIKADAADILYDDTMALCASAVRGTLIAPPGKKLAISDLSNIEGRVGAWLAGEKWKLKAFADFDAGIGHDLYRVAYGKAFNVDPSTVNKENRQIGKVMELFFLFGGGVGAWVTGAETYGIDLRKMADASLPGVPRDVINEAIDFLMFCREKHLPTFGLSDEEFLACDSLKRMWRRNHPNIKTIWQDLQDAFIAVAGNPAAEVPVGDHLMVLKRGTWALIRLPSGRFLCYPGVRVGMDKDDRPVISHLGINPYSRNWGRTHTYGGKLFENCLTAEVEVLTAYGWRAIVEVGSAPVWDGAAWVGHEGLVNKGIQHVITFGGVGVTPTHKIEVDKVWVEACAAGYEAATSSFARHHRIPDRLPDGSLLCRCCRQTQCGMAGSLRGVWQRFLHGTMSAAQRGAEILRLSALGNRPRRHPRHERAPGLSDLDEHAGAVRKPERSQLQKLRRAGHTRLREVVRIVREFLGRHGADVFPGAYTRPQKQRTGLLPRELPLGDAEGTNAQQTKQPQHWNTERGYAALASRGSIRVEGGYVAVPSQPRLLSGTHVRQALTQEQVYDLLNAGPNHCFTVRGADGRPFLVHNCTQAAARDVMANGMPAADDAGYKLVLSVHDELIAEVPDTDDFTGEGLSAILATNPPWAGGLPLAAGGLTTYRYRKE